MSILTADYTPVNVVQNPLFTLAINHKRTKSHIRMELKTPIVNTNALPKTYEILSQELPSILLANCFNEQNLPFSIELTRTEIGHLFEHILLEYLCDFKLLEGETNVEYNGVTNWNWNIDKKGVFHIAVDTTRKDVPVFSKALEKSIQLLTFILNTNSYHNEKPN